MKLTIKLSTYLLFKAHATGEMRPPLSIDREAGTVEIELDEDVIALLEKRRAPAETIEDVIVQLLSQPGSLRNVD